MEERRKKEKEKKQQSSKGKANSTIIFLEHFVFKKYAAFDTSKAISSKFFLLKKNKNQVSRKT